MPEQPVNSFPKENQTLPIQLCAGPISLLYKNGMIFSIRSGTYEIVRRVYMAVRDSNWNTIQGTIENEKIDKRNDSFSISFDMHHSRDHIAFKWHGECTGTENGIVRFSISGEALSDFDYNRIGFCVLHPLSLAGKPCIIDKTDGSVQDGIFPGFVSPENPFTGIRAVRYQVDSSVSVSVRCDGDVFEMEDQRNWTDATFKTYSTPQSIPLPLKIVRGNIITQEITLQCSGLSGIKSPTEDGNTNVTLEMDTVVNPLPQLGVMVPLSTELSQTAIRRLRELNLSHVRIDITPAKKTLIDELYKAASICVDLAAEAELAVHCGDNFAADIETLLDGLQQSSLPVKRFLLFAQNSRVTPRALVTTARPLLKGYAPEAQIGAGTDYYFAELNRARPGSLEGIDQLHFHATPQVHTFDDIAVMENIEGQAEALLTAHQFAANLPVSISPITLRPRLRRNSPQRMAGQTRARHRFSVRHGQREASSVASAVARIVSPISRLSDCVG